MDEATSEELLIRYREGDIKAFKQFYARSNQVLLLFLLKRIDNQQAAEELLQETFLRIHKHIVRYDSSRKAMPWVFAIARNTATDYLRRRKELSIEDMDIYTATQPQEGINDLLETALEVLSSSERKLVEARYFAEKSYEDIASSEMSTNSAVRKRLSRVVAKMRVKIAGDTGLK